MNTTTEEIERIRTNPFLLKFYLGGREAWEFYKKITHGRTTFHRYVDNEIVNQKYFPGHFYSEIEWFDNDINRAKKYKELLQKLQKMKMEMRAVIQKENDIKKEIEEERPVDYDDIISKYDDFMLNGPTYYYIVSDTRRIRYFSKITGRQVSRSEIPGVILDKIPCRGEATIRALKYKDVVENKLPEIQKQKVAFEEKLKLLEQDVLKAEVPNYQNILENHEKKVSDVKKRIEDRNNAFLESMKSGTKKRKYEDEFTEKAKVESTDKEKAEAEKILKTFSINNKSQWKEWLSKNHSDKGGSNNLTREVINAGQILYQ